jgi:hypothetical protein
LFHYRSRTVREPLNSTVPRQKRKKQEQTRTLLCLMFSVSPNRDHESYFIEL